MDKYDIKYASEHLDELTERAKRGEEVSIGVPGQGMFRIQHVGASDAPDTPRRPVPGQWKGRLTIPERLFEPLSDIELEWLSGENSP